MTLQLGATERGSQVGALVPEPDGGLVAVGNADLSLAAVRVDAAGRVQWSVVHTLPDGDVWGRIGGVALQSGGERRLGATLFRLTGGRRAVVRVPIDARGRRDLWWARRTPRVRVRVTNNPAAVLTRRVRVAR